jgi:hypothetical protein
MRKSAGFGTWLVPGDRGGGDMIWPCSGPAWEKIDSSLSLNGTAGDVAAHVRPSECKYRTVSGDASIARLTQGKNYPRYRTGNQAPPLQRGFTLPGTLGLSKEVGLTRGHPPLDTQQPTGSITSIAGAFVACWVLTGRGLTHCDILKGASDI